MEETKGKRMLNEKQGTKEKVGCIIKKENTGEGQRNEEENLVDATCKRGMET